MESVLLIAPGPVGRSLWDAAAGSNDLYLLDPHPRFPVSYPPRIRHPKPRVEARCDPNDITAPMHT